MAMKVKCVFIKTLNWALRSDPRKEMETDKRTDKDKRLAEEDESASTGRYRDGIKTVLNGRKGEKKKTFRKEDTMRKLYK